MTDSDKAGSDGPHYEKVLKPLSAEEYHKRKFGDGKPHYLSSGNTFRRIDIRANAETRDSGRRISRTLRDRADGKQTIWDVLLLVIGAGVLFTDLFIHPLSGNADVRREHLPESGIVPVLLFILAMFIIWLVDRFSGGGPDPVANFEHNARFNLVERGLLRRALAAANSHELLPPAPGILNTEIISSWRSLPTEESRILYLIANYPEICERNGYPWALKGIEYHRRKGQLFYGKEDRHNPYNRKLCAIIDELLSSGRY